MKTFIATILAAVALMTLPAFAQTTTPGVEGPGITQPANDTATVVLGTGGVPSFLEPYDVDQNGRISSEENQAYREFVRQSSATDRDFDTNDDGVLSDAEKDAARTIIRTRIEQRRIARFNQEDTDGTPGLSFTEFRNIPAVNRLELDVAQTLFNRLDTNDEENSQPGVLELVEFLVHLESVRPLHPVTVNPATPTSTVPQTATPVNGGNQQQADPSPPSSPSPPPAPPSGPSSTIPPSDNL